MSGWALGLYVAWVVFVVGVFVWIQIGEIQECRQAHSLRYCLVN